jgi:hypothetical protein
VTTFDISCYVEETTCIRSPHAGEPVDSQNGGSVVTESKNEVRKTKCPAVLLEICFSYVITKF